MNFILIFFFILVFSKTSFSFFSFFTRKECFCTKYRYTGFVSNQCEQSNNIFSIFQGIFKHKRKIYNFDFNSDDKTIIIGCSTDHILHLFKDSKYLMLENVQKSDNFLNQLNFLNNLVELSLIQNKITYIPKLNRLANLENLNLKSNEISLLTESSLLPESIKSLDFSFNNIYFIHKNFFTRFKNFFGLI